MRHRALADGAVVGALVVLLSACGGSDESRPTGAPMAARPEAAREAADNAPPVIERVVLSPARPRSGQELEVRAEVRDPDGDAVRLSYEWRVNGGVVERTSRASFALVDRRKGDRVEVRVSATDGLSQSEVRSARTEIANQPPVVTGVVLDPGDDVQPGQELHALPEAGDPDGDSLRYEVAWLVNGREVDAAGMVFDTSALRRGDAVKARVRASDGEEWSRASESGELRMANRPPTVRAVPQLAGEEGVFRYTLEAEDPDGDRNLRFQLVEGPQGMRLDPILGALEWRPSFGQVGTHPVEVSVQDAAGATSAVRLELRVAATGGDEPAPAALAP